MPTESFKPILDRDTAIESAKPIIDMASPILKETVNYATPHPGLLDEWQELTSAPGTFEHASWIGGTTIKSLLSGRISQSAITSTELKSKSNQAQLKLLLSLHDRFVARTTDEGSLESLIDRNIILDQVTRGILSET